MIPQYCMLKSRLPKYRMKKSPIPQYRKPPCPPPTWNRPVIITSKCETQSGKKKLLSQSVEYSMHCIHYAKKRARKTSIVQADSRVKFHTIISSIHLLSRATNHKQRKKLATQKQRHMSLRLCRIRTLYCVLIRRCSM